MSIVQRPLFYNLRSMFTDAPLGTYAVPQTKLVEAAQKTETATGLTGITSALSAFENTMMGRLARFWKQLPELKARWLNQVGNAQQKSYTSEPVWEGLDDEGRHTVIKCRYEDGKPLPHAFTIEHDGVEGGQLVEQYYDQGTCELPKHGPVSLATVQWIASEATAEKEGVQPTFGEVQLSDHWSPERHRPLNTVSQGFYEALKQQGVTPANPPEGIGFKQHTAIQANRPEQNTDHLPIIFVSHRENNLARQSTPEAIQTYAALTGEDDIIPLP